jgi:hypothetical protein
MGGLGSGNKPMIKANLRLCPPGVRNRRQLRLSGLSASAGVADLARKAVHY